MNSRDNKPNYPNSYFHAFNRGVKKDPIFLDDQDYLNFLYRARVLLGIIPPPKRTSKGGLRLTVMPLGSIEVLAYCLMPNHFHFLVKQRDIDAMKIFFHRLSTSYATYFNKKYERVGHVFQDVFKCKNILDDVYMTHVSAYIHANPAQPFNWQYSSLPEFLGLRSDDFVKADILMSMYNLTHATYKDFLMHQFNFSLLEQADLLFEND